MNNAAFPFGNPREVLHALKIHWRFWLLPALAVGLAAVGFALLKSDAWEASQALVVRNEASNNERGPGKFAQVEEMKTVQETLLELSRSRSVLEAALLQAGPPENKGGLLESLFSSNDSRSWPTARDVDDFRRQIKLAPPKGAEFGKTEVFYLTVRDADRGRAAALCEALCRRLQTRFQQLRDAKAQSMIAELVKTVNLAKNDQAESTRRLAETETHIGSDLAELRSMQDIGSSDSSLRRNKEETQNLLRETKATAKGLGGLLAILQAARQDPGRLMATPNRLLESQPALRRLKDGLVDAQLVTATMMGGMTAAHPRVKSAQEAEREIVERLHAELPVAVRGIEVELKMNADRQTLLEEQLAKTENRLNRLADVRAEYERQAAENKHRTLLVERAEQNLAEARAAEAAANAASLVSRIDAPDTGSKPVGPGRTTIAACGLIGGLIVGLGLFFFLLPAGPLARSQEDFIHETFAATPVKIHSPASHAAGAKSPASPIRRALEKLHGNGRK